jgi:type II restriction enzyme
MTYKFSDKPVNLRVAERLRINAVKEVYSFYPKLLLEEIGEDIELSDLLDLPKLIEIYSKNPDNSKSKQFEEVLTDGFNRFNNVDAVWVGGSGEPDIECLYTSVEKKFAVDAKSTKDKLSTISAGRLKSHRERIGADYTIVIPPLYVPAVLHDIKDAAIVLLRASTFAEYLYYNTFYGERNIDYADFDNIITENYGKDISDLISDLTFSTFAAIE